MDSPPTTSPPVESQSPPTERDSWLDRPLARVLPLNLETLIFALIIILAVVSRFYDLGARVMSHDENTHVYYSWRFMRGEGFAHDPLMHGPLQFHLIASTYFLFGDSDFTARLPHAVFSILTVAFMWYYRRYLGRAGALVGAVLMLISPYMLYYGRYARNEAFVGLFGVVMIWAILRYLETGRNRYMYWLTAVNVLHFTAKETSFIYTAQALIFLAVLLLLRLLLQPWRQPAFRRLFLLALIASLALFAAGFGYALVTRHAESLSGAQTAAPSIPNQEAVNPQEPLQDQGPSEALLALVVLGSLALLAAVGFAIQGYSLETLRSERSFGMLIVMGTLVLPQLAPFPIRFAGWTLPTNASQVMALTMTDILHIAAFVVPLLIISVLVGMLWNWREWLVNAGIWYALFTVFYTSVFTNGPGLFTGLVGSLGYWLEQQGVNRGSQPPYYYALVQMPVYEFLPMLGAWLAFGLALFAGLRSWQPKPALAAGQAGSELDADQALRDEWIALADEMESSQVPGEPPRPVVTVDYTAEFEPAVKPDWLEDMPGFAEARQPEADEAVETERLPEDAAPAGSTPERIEPAPVFPLLGFWAVTSLIAYSVAGEKMPWLTFHITLPAILCAAWAIGKVSDGFDWQHFRQRNGWLVLALLPVLFYGFLGFWGSLLGPTPPLQGKSLDQLSATSTFLLSLLALAGAGFGISYLVRRWPRGQFSRLLTLAAFTLLGLVTTHTAVQATYINYDNANELLVYAHAGGGVKTAMAQIEEISRRTTDGLAAVVAYDNETSYPYWWYLRNYPNSRYYGSDPSRSLREAPLILVGDANYGKIEPVVGNAYYRFDYIRMWWPNQDYFGLTWERVRNALRDPGYREALFQIWLNRDYTLYGQLTSRDMSLPNWNPAARMRLYIRKDIANALWNYGAAPVTEAIQADPFEGKEAKLSALTAIGGLGSQPGLFQGPRDMAIAPDGTLYVADTGNHRIQHLTPEGVVLNVWGSFGDVGAGAGGGSFNQPWGIGLGPDGSVYVADTWNHRIQKFNAEGQFLTMWGFFGQGESPQAFWGPRDVAVNAQGQVFVTDTGNKRVVVFDSEGNYLAQFGGAGLLPGQLDEPVGITIDSDGLIYVADTWNQRIQVFLQSEGDFFQSLRVWELTAWYGQSLDNKPYLAVDNRGHLFAVDPEGYRVLEFTVTGEAVRAWGEFGSDLSGMGLTASVAVDAQGGVWVVDATNNRLLYFGLP